MKGHLVTESIMLTHPMHRWVERLKYKEKRRTFILGAGFSAAAGLPLVSELSLKCLSALESRGCGDFDFLINQMRRFFPDTSWALRSLPNIEDFLDRVLAYEDLFGNYTNVFHKGYFDNVKRVTSLALSMALVAYLGKWNTRTVDAFVERLQPGDTVLTFNWDLLVETALFKRNRDIVLYCPTTYDKKMAATKITFIKLHGSIDWLNNKQYKPAKGSENEWELMGHDIWKAKNQRHFASSSVGVPAFIIPPTSRKEYAEHPDIKQFWDVAFWNLLHSLEIYIIGYGFAKADIHSRALVQAGILNNVHGRLTKVVLINNNEKALSDFHKDIVPCNTCDASQEVTMSQNYDWTTL